MRIYWQQKWLLQCFEVVMIVALVDTDEMGDGFVQMLILGQEEPISVK